MDEVRALLLHSVGHQLLLGALGADDVLTVRDEALPHLRRVRADVQTFSHQERLKHNDAVSILTMLDLQDEQMKQSLCQWRPSNEMNRVPPIPETSHAPASSSSSVRKSNVQHRAERKEGVD